MKFVKLESPIGDTVYVNPDAVNFIGPAPPPVTIGSCGIYIGTTCVVVKGRKEEICTLLCGNARGSTRSASPTVYRDTVLPRILPSTLEYLIAKIIKDEYTNTGCNDEGHSTAAAHDIMRLLQYNLASIPS